MAKIKTPFKDLLPPLSTQEKDALRADIKEHGQRDDVIVDEDNNILDGHNRYDILKSKAKTVVLKGLTEGEKEAFVFRSNFTRRNLSREQRKEAMAKMKATMAKLRKEKPKHWTQSRVATVLGVSRQTVTYWENPRTNANVGKSSKPSKKTPKPDARVKVNPDGKRDIVKRVNDGESQAQVASDYDISQKQVSNILAKDRKDKEKARRRRAKIAEAKKISGGNEMGVYHEPFLECAKRIPDGSLELIFTDPPYDDKSLPLFDDLGTVAFDKLQEGGSLLTFFGQHRLDRVVSSLTGAGLKFFWPICIYHTGKSSRMDYFGIVVKWKPVLWFVKGNNRIDVHTFVDDAIESTQEKDTHPWQQSVIEATYYIERLSLTGSLIFDPFCGGGTTSVAAKQCGRKWITCDVNEESVALARERISDVS